MNHKLFTPLILVGLALFLFNYPTEIASGADNFSNFSYGGETSEDGKTIYLPLVMNAGNTTSPTATPTATPRPAGPTEVCGVISGAQTWTTAGSPYIATCDVTVGAGSSLTVMAGVIVKFRDDASLFVEGTLQVLGTAEQIIYFTSYDDDSIGGDSNNNGSATVPHSGDWGRIQFNSTSNDSDSSIEYLKVSYGGDDRGQVAGGYRGGAIQLDNASPTLHNITFLDNYINAVDIPSSQWETDTWDNTDIVYYVRGDVTIQTGQTLTVTAGVKVKFSDDASLFINGTLRVLGTADNPVYFTSYDDDLIGGDSNNNGSATVPHSGDWGRIQFNSTSNDSDSSIEYLKVSYGGDDRGQVAGGYRGGAIQLDNASPTLHNITFLDNYINAVDIPSSQWETDTWDNTDIVYYVRGDVTIQTGQTLTVAAGVKVKFSDDASLFINGTLRVLGTADNPVYFTSYDDDLIGGDSNNNGSATVPHSGDWGRIQFNSTSNDSDSSIEYLKVSYGGDDRGQVAGGYRGGAIRLEGKSITISHTTFQDNYRGVEALANAAPVIHNSNFSGQQSYAIYNATPTVAIDARNNWWGSSSGPHHLTKNPSGQGEEVSDGVDFSEWSATEN